MIGTPPMPRRAPYNPASAGSQVDHDRRAREINRGLAAHVVEAVVPDPYGEPGERISVLRSVRGDPLNDHLLRRHIDRAQFEAGRAFQHHWQLAERGPRAMRLTERVDCSRGAADGMSPAQARAWQWLDRCRHEIGVAGMMLLHAMLIDSMSAAQVAASRGLIGRDWARFFMKWLRLCLEAVAQICGFASRARAAGNPA
jgi:hypothetical protein